MKALMAGGIDPLMAQGVRGWLIALGVMLMMLVQKGKADFRLVRPRAWLMWLRGLSMFVGSVLIFIAISKIEQATVTAMIFLYPLLVGLLGVLFLGEHIGPRRVIFIVLGFVGVALAAGVTPSTFEFWAILPALGAVLISTQAISVRWVADRMSNLELSYITAISMALCGTPFLFMGSFTELGWTQIGLFALVGVLGTTGSVCLSFAFKHAPMGLVGSLNYSSIIFSTMLAWIFFAEVPAFRVFVAMGLIILAGVGYMYFQHRAEVASANS